MLVLGIETSCDETAAAIVEDGVHIRSSVVASQEALHAEYGGVVPEIACRAHLETMVPVVKRCMREAAAAPAQIDAVAVTHRPGLIGALLIGVCSAKALAYSWDRPLVGVNHLHAHLYGAILSAPAEPELAYPLVGLVVSGGHTSLFLTRSPIEHEPLGSTTDDAAGEAFDKVAKVLGLGYPGGPAIDQAAKAGRPDAVAFPRARLKDRPLDFSFSGLKTAVLYHCRGQDRSVRDPAPALDAQTVADVAASFQEAVVDVLVDRTLEALRRTGAHGVLLGGGVAANSRLRERLPAAAAAAGAAVCCPPRRLCTDNAAVVAGVAYHQVRAGQRCGLDLDALPR